LTHSELIQRGNKWLTNTMKCKFVLSEVYSNSYEIPDVIGWDCWSKSILIECKASRSDFFADQSKTHRAYSSMGMGVYRYYMTEPRLVRPEEIPQQWGLLWVYPTIVRVVKESSGFDDVQAAYREMPLLCAALTRMEARGYLKNVKWSSDIEL
jgi:hypothetical protein